MRALRKKQEETGDLPQFCGQVFLAKATVFRYTIHLDMSIISGKEFCAHAHLWFEEEEYHGIAGL